MIRMTQKTKLTAVTAYRILREHARHGSNGWNGRWMSRQDLMVNLSQLIGSKITGASLNRVTDLLIKFGIVEKGLPYRNASRIGFRYISQQETVDTRTERLRDVQNWKAFLPIDLGFRLSRLDKGLNGEYTPNQDALPDAGYGGGKSGDQLIEEALAAQEDAAPEPEAEPEVTAEQVKEISEEFEQMPSEAVKDIFAAVIEEAMTNDNWNGIKNVISLP